MTTYTIMAFIDVSFGVHHSTNSHNGVAIIIGKGQLYAKSTEQKLNSKLCTEAEFIGVADGLITVGILRSDFNSLLTI